MDKTNDGIDERILTLHVIKELNRVIRGHQIDRKTILTLGDLLDFIEIAIANVEKSVKIEKSKKRLG